MVVPFDNVLLDRVMFRVIVPPVVFTLALDKIELFLDLSTFQEIESHIV